MPLNEKYRPDPHKWVCTCLAFVHNWFLICKHLIQPVQPTFFLQMKRNRTLPFWQHPTLVPLEGLSHPAMDATPARNEGNGEQERSGEIGNCDGDDTDNVVDTESILWVGDGSTYHEGLTHTIATIWYFCNGLEYQLQFEDQQMLDTLEKEWASFLWLAKACLNQERWMNTMRELSPTTWEQGTSNAMWYQTRPHCEDVNT